ncbi:poly-beta-1,6-N-acetyl-D-glucosamine N-deacetylase PgaB [Bdellovibrio svalbardensis]|uniref:Poly-beta-1,6-N-acetyl-D-glucosamine N-deacetylase PgaB n=1 Tax=Bdellovibrio svalbardensis TaxID=2972972 RepID=A0ABT6DP63_9BACT|nr:poly-beta-1,6-N-acetyl-D-glucosamine N-deacetylase PgaB [Bdellovibrio svalbardensis]MDG0817714.1 poly-beta-1,6-N-acetyl-D-glucosamine N-deacetylase PgaB [Bdellovibrio svalbardensis]
MNLLTRSSFKLFSQPGFTNAIAIAVALLFASTPLKSLASTNDFDVLCYHDVSKTPPKDAYGITLAQLQEQFEFLQKNYAIVSIDDVILASQGKKTLPAKAVLITFDDGLASFYDLVYPLLKRYKLPAVFAVVGKWVEDGKAPDYGYADVNPPMVTWKQLKEMSDSGLVAVVSHTYDMHHGHIFNPQGNEQASAGFLRFNLESKSFETEKDFFARVKTDLAKNEDLIRKHIGKNYPLIVWPYGTYNGLSQKAATELGMPMQFSIDKGLNNTGNLTLVHRGMLLSHYSLSTFAEGMKTSFVYEAPVRAVSVDLDSLWVGSEDESNVNLGKLNDKTAEVRPNLALIQTFSAKGEAYFPTSQLTMKANFFPRVAHILQNRSRVEKVYAAVPLQYLKNSPNPEQLIHDLATYSDIDGIFFDSRGAGAKKIEKLIEQAMKTGSEMRPSWNYGLIGPVSSIKTDKFKYIIKDFYWGSSKSKLSKTVREFQDPKMPTMPTMIASFDAKNVAGIPESYKKMRDLGLNNFFLPISLNSYTDLSFLKINFHSTNSPFSFSQDEQK